MRNFALTTSLSALLVSLPLAGAFADTSFVDTDYQSAAGISRVDPVRTSSIGAAASQSYASQLDASLRAAETNLRPGGPDSAVAPTVAAGIRAELNAIKQAATQEKRANGGELSAASYRTLSERVRAVQQESVSGVR